MKRRSPRTARPTTSATPGRVGRVVETARGYHVYTGHDTRTRLTTAIDGPYRLPLVALAVCGLIIATAGMITTNPQHWYIGAGIGAAGFGILGVFVFFPNMVWAVGSAAVTLGVAVFAFQLGALLDPNGLLAISWVFATVGIWAGILTVSYLTPAPLWHRWGFVTAVPPVATMITAMGWAYAINWMDISLWLFVVALTTVLLAGLVWVAPYWWRGHRLALADADTIEWLTDMVDDLEADGWYVVGTANPVAFVLTPPAGRYEPVDATGRVRQYVLVAMGTGSGISQYRTRWTNTLQWLHHGRNIVPWLRRFVPALTRTTQPAPAVVLCLPPGNPSAVDVIAVGWPGVRYDTPVGVYPVASGPDGFDQLVELMTPLTKLVPPPEPAPDTVKDE